MASATQKRRAETRTELSGARERSAKKRWLVGTLLLCGALPLVAYLAIDSGHATGLGFATVFGAFALRALLRDRSR